MVKKTVLRKQRSAPRKETYPVRVEQISSLNDLAKIAKGAEVIQASSTGLLIQLERGSLIPQRLRSNLDLDILVGTEVYLRLKDMELEISGTITRTKFLGKKGFLLAVDYSEEAPEYWRECLMELLPSPKEIN